MSYSESSQGPTSSRSLTGRIGAFTLHSLYNPIETTAKARQTFLASFEKAVDPDGTLPEEERQRRAAAARRAHFARLAFMSAEARRKRSAQQVGQPPKGAGT